MKLGDIVQYENQNWMVRRYDDRETRLAVIQNAQGQNVEIPHDLDSTEDCRVVAHPQTDWPYVIVRESQRGKFITALTRVVRGRKVPLTLLVDWLPNDPARPGGPLYLNPQVGIQPAEVLLVSWSNGPDTSVQVPVHMGTVAQRVLRVERKKPQEVTNYDRLLQDRFDEDD